MNQELRETVARAIHDSYADGVPWSGCEGECAITADAAIAAATPLIEAALIERLAGEALTMPEDFIYQEVLVSGDAETEYTNMGDTVAGWLRAQLPGEG